MDYHSAKWAKFLTAEAFYTLFSVDDGLVIDHFYCHCGADLLTLPTALTILIFDGGLGFQRTSCHLAEKL